MRGRFPSIVVATVLMLAASACSGGGGSAAAPTSTVARIAEDRALSIARRAWTRVEPNFDFSTRRSEVAVRGETYDIAFVDRDLHGNQGEPHVVVDRNTGRVRETYRTR